MGDPSYPKMGHGFPRNYIPNTPQEILYDHERVLGARVKMEDTGITVLRQPRLETTSYRQVTELGGVIQIRKQNGSSVTLDKAILEAPFQFFATQAVVIGLSAYIFLTTPYVALRFVAAAAGLNSLYQAGVAAYELSQDPKVAYQETRPSLEV